MYFYIDRLLTIVKAKGSYFKISDYLHVCVHLAQSDFSS